MTIGLANPLPAYTIDPAFMARKAEALGFESIWYAEYPAVPVHSASSGCSWRLCQGMSVADGLVGRPLLTADREPVSPLWHTASQWPRRGR